jgi:hypothetical protein
MARRLLIPLFVALLAPVAACGDDDGGDGSCTPAFEPDFIDIIKGAFGIVDVSADCPDIDDGGGQLITGEMPEGITCTVMGSGSEMGPVENEVRVDVAATVEPGEYPVEIGVYRYALPGMPVYGSFIVNVLDCEPGIDCPEPP